MPSGEAPGRPPGRPLRLLLGIGRRLVGGDLGEREEEENDAEQDLGPTIRRAMPDAGVMSP